MPELVSPQRPRYKKAEAAQPWLAALLDAYLEIVRGVHEAVRQASRRGRRLACEKDCAACCRSHPDISVYPLELMGLYWYCIEQVAAAPRERLRRGLAHRTEGAGCPFLIDETCGVHPLRPMACRQFNVFDRVCAEGEDAFHPRPQDVMTPIRRFADAAFDRLLLFYGVKEKGARLDAIRSGPDACTPWHAPCAVSTGRDWPHAWKGPPDRGLDATPVSAHRCHLARPAAPRPCGLSLRCDQVLRWAARDWCEDCTSLGKSLKAPDPTLTLALMSASSEMPASPAVRAPGRLGWGAAIRGPMPDHRGPSAWISGGWRGVAP